ncbi:hypothetical protein [Dyadobacter sp. CY351]|uniref:hypothetical protein n=1 Tax=Dyadobacter sp. CY351 TaxID=2909337 RepID=UPI001F49002F|nr:hypothetical protein [Dyadobacter sp. CY351]
MRNLLNICKMLPILVLVLGSCKTKSPDPQNTPITMSDLADYYLVAEHKTGGNKLTIISFAKDGDVVKADIHLQGMLRILEGTLQGSTLSLDFHSNGQSIYSFELEKNADGSLKLKSYDFIYNGEGNQLSYAVLAKKSDAFSFDNSSFKVNSERLKFIKDNDAETLWWFGRSYLVYKLANVGFKSNQDELMGAAVPNWRGIAKPVMLIEQEDKIWIAEKE